MLIVTTDTINGKELEALGLVKGSTIQTVNALRDIGAGLKTLIGGELKKYNDMMDNARKIATDRMEEEARRLGADAIVGVRYATSGIMQSAAEVMAYGTAVRYRWTSHRHHARQCTSRCTRRSGPCRRVSRSSWQR